MVRSFQTSMTLLSLPWISVGAPLYAIDVASATTGEKAMIKSSLWRILDCCATSKIAIHVSQVSVPWKLEEDGGRTIGKVDQT